MEKKFRMKVSEFTALCGFEVICPGNPEKHITGGYTSDLLSDVLGNAAEGSVLITIQAHRNTVAVAFQVDLPAIVVCNGREIPADMVEAAVREGIAIFRTKDNQFTATRKIFYEVLDR